MSPEELPKSDEPYVSLEESAPEKTIATPPFGAPEQRPPHVPPPHFSATQWVIGLLVLALVGYPLVRWARNRSVSPAAVSAAATLNPNARAMLNQSFSLYRAGKYEEAITAGKALVKDNPNVADGWNNLAASYAALGRWDEAVKSAQEALRIEPEHQLAKANLAYAQRARASGAPPPSQAAAPGTLPYFLNLSAADFQNGKFPECIEDAGKAIKLSPNSSEAFNNRGACYGSLGMFEEEIQSEQEAIRLNPGNQLAKNNQAWALRQKKLRDAVREKK